MLRKSDHICLCISHKCANGTVTLPLGETQAGKFVSRQTLNNHCNADEELYENTKDKGLQSNSSNAAQLEGTVPFRSIQASHVTMPSQKLKCHDCHGHSGGRPKMLYKLKKKEEKSQINPK